MLQLALERWMIEGLNVFRDTLFNEEALVDIGEMRWSAGQATESSPQPNSLGGISIEPVRSTGVSICQNEAANNYSSKL
jgi:hypothetical protein